MSMAGECKRSDCDRRQRDLYRGSNPQIHPERNFNQQFYLAIECNRAAGIDYPENQGDCKESFAERVGLLILG